MATTPGYRTILRHILQEGDAATAITLTLERNDNAYSFYKYCRQKALADDTHREPRYLQRVRHFQHLHYSPQDPEWDKLNTLMEGPLRTQYRVETSPDAYLTDPERDEALKEIRCMPDAFYEYRMPTWVIDEAQERQNFRREFKHSHVVTIANVQTLFSRAQNWREYSHPWELVACALLLCGRRIEEVTTTLHWEAESNFVIKIRGLVKQRNGDGVIPILIPYRDFTELMARIREHCLPTTSTTHRLKPAFLRVYGEWLNHTQRRNIYCELAYRLRYESGFFPELSRVMWFDKALCHDTNVIHQATNLTYQTLNFRDE